MGEVLNDFHRIIFPSIYSVSGAEVAGHLEFGIEQIHCNDLAGVAGLGSD